LEGAVTPTKVFRDYCLAAGYALSEIEEFLKDARGCFREPRDEDSEWAMIEDFLGVMIELERVAIGIVGRQNPIHATW
jgi:hypothetical protein